MKQCKCTKYTAANGFEVNPTARIKAVCRAISFSTVCRLLRTYWIFLRKRIVETILYTKYVHVVFLSPL